jgi:thiamine-monophosphate kinase
MPEFELIDRLHERIGRPGGGIALGIGDDAAVLQVPPGLQLVACTDTLVEGVHFEPSVDPRALGHKSLALNLSDLAAMGAEPAWFLLALTLPGDDADWLDRFAGGMADAALESRVFLAGGDTTRGSLSVTVTALGFVPPGAALTRGGARPGDRVFVSGAPGRAAFALQGRRAGRDVPYDCASALDFPAPRLALGLALRGVATACIDVSDGLAADLGHVLRQSGAGAQLDLGGLPVPAALSGLSSEQRWTLQLAGGDDYELCFTAPESRVGDVNRAALEAAVPVHEIGTVHAGEGLVLLQPDGRPFELAGAGYDHFADSGGERA